MIDAPDAPVLPLPSTAVLHHGDCLDVMPRLDADSVAMVFADLPYATHKNIVTSNHWDTPFCLQSFWDCLRAALRKNSVAAFTAKQLFATSLIASNPSQFRYDLIWNKVRPSRHLHAKRMPLLKHESVLLFYKPPCTYNPIMTKRDVDKRRGVMRVHSTNAATPNFVHLDAEHVYTERYPTTIIDAQRENYTIHPTQKPVALLEWLISTYTNPGDTVLDPVFGSNTTGVACARLGRNYIGIEMDPEYFRIGRERLDGERAKLGLAPCEAITLNNP